MCDGSGEEDAGTRSLSAVQRTAVVEVGSLSDAYSLKSLVANCAIQTGRHAVCVMSKDQGRS